MKKLWIVSLFIGIFAASAIATTCVASNDEKPPINDEGPGDVIVDIIDGKPPVNDEGPGKGGKK